MSSGAPRPVKERLRDARAHLVLEVAQDRLIEKGYRDVSMDEIAARAGVAKATLYQHFPHKEDLVLALFERHVVLFEQTVERASEAPAPARERIERVLRYVYEDHDGAYAMLQLLTHNVEIRRSLAARKDERGFQRMERTTVRVRRILEEGREDGSIHPGISTDLALRAFLGALTLGRPEPGSALEQLPQVQLAAQVGRILFDGIGRGARRK